jgi:hypothetical protein
MTRRRLRERATKAEPAATISAPLSTKRHALNPVTARAGVPDEEEVAAACTVGTAVAGVMVMVAALLVAVPPALVKTALTSQPFTRAVRDDAVSEGEVAPERLAQVLPPSIEYCHCTVGVGMPLAPAVNVRVPPDGTDWLVGWVVTAGAMVGTV